MDDKAWAYEELANEGKDKTNFRSSFFLPDDAFFVRNRLCLSVPRKKH